MSEDEDFARSSTIGKCPICGGKLEKGYLKAPRYWTIERQSPGTITLDYVMPGHLWIADIVPALKCENWDRNFRSQSTWLYAREFPKEMC